MKEGKERRRKRVMEEWRNGRSERGRKGGREETYFKEIIG